MRHWTLLVAWSSTAGIMLATIIALAVVRPMFAATWAVAFVIMFTPAILTFILQKFWKVEASNG